MCHGYQMQDYMHGFAFNVNTDLLILLLSFPVEYKINRLPHYKELGREVPMEEVKIKLKNNFEKVFGCSLKG